MAFKVNFSQLELCVNFAWSFLSDLARRRPGDDFPVRQEIEPFAIEAGV